MSVRFAQHWFRQANQSKRTGIYLSETIEVFLSHFVRLSNAVAEMILNSGHATQVYNFHFHMEILPVIIRITFNFLEEVPTQMILNVQPPPVKQCGHDVDL